MIADTVSSPTLDWRRDEVAAEAAPWTKRLSILPATPSDHAAVFQFLTAVFQGPTRDEFRASQADPCYEPRDRLLVVSGGKIVGHVQILHRVLRLGAVEVPIAGLVGFGLLPEVRGLGLGRRLLTAVEERMTAAGAPLGLLWTRIPHFFRASGWGLCGRREVVQVGVRRLLSELSARGLYPRSGKRLQVRPLRLLEIAALERIYRRNMTDRYGPLVRTESAWEWLVGRHGYDQILVAVDGPEVLDLEERARPIKAYMATRGERIVELLADRSHAATELLGRACRDVIERGRHTIQLDASADHPAQSLFFAAGGETVEAGRGEVCMARLVDPIRLLQLMGVELARRAEAAALPPLFRVGFVVDAQGYRLQRDDEGMHATAADAISLSSPAELAVALNVADFTRMLLGRLDWSEAIAHNRLRPSSPLALEIARTLFPQMPWWQPSLDDLPAREDGWELGKESH